MHSPPTQPLTPRESQVVSLVAEGLSNREIGHRLHISRHTVRTYLNSVFAKLGASNRAQAAVLAERSGQIEEVPLAS